MYHEGQLCDVLVNVLALAFDAFLGMSRLAEVTGSVGVRQSKDFEILAWGTERGGSMKMALW